MFTAKITANIQAKAKREHTPEFPKKPKQIQKHTIWLQNQHHFGRSK